MRTGPREEEEEEEGGGEEEKEEEEEKRRIRKRRTLTNTAVPICTSTSPLLPYSQSQTLTQPSLSAVHLTGSLN
jgi:hypothetical protein